eukprot:3900927-Pyramimonas_sp.AAC.1
MRKHVIIVTEDMNGHTEDMNGHTSSCAKAVVESGSRDLKNEKACYNRNGGYEWSHGGYGWSHGGYEWSYLNLR